MRLFTPIAVSVLTCVSVNSATVHASDSIEELTVVASRVETSVNDLTSTVNIIDSDRLQRELARDIKDVIRFEPGVVVGGTGSRFGLDGFNIRGIGGNRVLTMIDGIRVPDEFSFGPFLSARRDFVDIDSINRVEIARGPVSSAWGSDALGGVVAFTTVSPSATLGDDRFKSKIKVGYSSADDSTVTTLQTSGKIDELSALISYTRRESSETDNQGNVGGTSQSRELPDPQSMTTENLSLKVAFEPTQDTRLLLSMEQFDNETDSILLSDAGTISRGTLIESRAAFDIRDRTRVSFRLDLNVDSAIADTVSAKIYSQSSETLQNMDETRLPPPYMFPQFRTRDSIFEQTLKGASFEVTKAFTVGNWDHSLTYGVERFETESESTRDGGTVDSSGAPLFEFSPLPTRDFPTTNVETTAIFIQSEIALLSDRFLLMPGLRYDDVEATATPDMLYFAGNPGVGAPTDFADSETSLKLGALYRLDNNSAIFANYSQGFRAPPYDDVNLGFSNAMGGYKTVSAPNLTSETSEGIEIGLRTRDEHWNASIAIFQTDFDDFIAAAGDGHCSRQYQITGCRDPLDGFLVFQSENLESVTIEGVEIKAELDLASVGLESMDLRFAAAYASGEETNTNNPVNTIQPISGVLGLSYRNPAGVWSASTVLTLVSSKDQSDIAEGSPAQGTSGYGLVDIFASYTISNNLSVRAGLYNVTDKTYIQWPDAVAIGSDAALRFTQPGINGSVDIRYEF
jgi:hemoglobin/transferrin/lactoferrin receptor protein